MLGTKDNNRDNDDNADDDHLIFLVSINLNSRTADKKKKIRRHSPHFQNFKDINQPVSSSFADEKRQYIQILVSGNKRNKKKRKSYALLSLVFLHVDRVVLLRFLE